MILVTVPSNLHQFVRYAGRLTTGFCEASMSCGCRRQTGPNPVYSPTSAVNFRMVRNPTGISNLPPNRTSGYASYLQVVPFMVA